MDLELGGKVIVVSGGGNGIGRAIAVGLAAEGAIPVAVDQDLDALNDLSAELETRGAAHEIAHADLSHSELCGRAVADAAAKHGGLDGLVNNAGGNDRVGLEATPDAFSKSLERNLTHYFSMAHFCLPWLKSRGGAIVNIASKVALTGQGGTSGYAASKGAQLGLTREWAAELAPHGIRVNAVLPAEVDTPMYARWLDTFDHPQQKRAAITAHIPLGKRMTSVREVADCVLFLLSPRSNHTTGQWISVDGGYTHLDRSISGHAPSSCDQSTFDSLDGIEADGKRA